MATSASKLNTTDNGVVQTTGGDGTLSIGALGINDLSDAIALSSNIFIGDTDQYGSRTTASYNTSLGYNALDEITSGNSNTAVGNLALTSNTTGYENSSIGSNSLRYNTSGFGNSALGRRSLESNTTGRYNVAVGQEALLDNTTGNNNTAVGISALPNSSTANNNVSVGGFTLYNTTGGGNTALGYYAGDVLTTGTNNVIIGYNSEVSSSSASNQTVIGYEATAQANNSVTLGNSSVTAIYAAQDAGATLYAGGLNIGGTDVTSTAAELNIVDGNTTAATVTLAGTDGIVVNDDGTMKQALLSDISTFTNSNISLSDASVTNAKLANSTITVSDGSNTTAVSLGGTVTYAGTANEVEVSESSGTVTIGLPTAVTVGSLTDGTATLSNGTLSGVTEVSMTTLDIGGTDVTSTAAELNIVDGNTTAATVTLAGTDGIVVNDDGTMKQALLSDISTFTNSNISLSDASVTNAKLANSTITVSDGSNTTAVSLGGTVTYAGTANEVEVSESSGTVTIGLPTAVTVGSLTDGTATLSNGTLSGVTEVSMTTLDIGGTDVTSTAAELNIVDGGTSAISTIVVDADRVVLNDDGTMKQVSVTDLKTYVHTNTSLDDLSDVKIQGNSIYLGNEPSSTSYVSGGNADDNVGFGSDALSNTTTGHKNVAIGNGALNALTVGHGNMAVGYNSLNRLVDGTGNVAIGRQSLTNVTDGIRNVAIGRQSGINVDDTDLPGGADLTTGDNNVYIGAHTQPSDADAQNETVIGYGTTGKGNNTVTIGNSTVETSGAVYAGQNGEANIYAKGLTRATDAIAEDLTISLTGSNDASINIVSQGTGSDAIILNATAGGVDVDAAAAKDVNIAGGQVALVSKDDAASAISLTANQGTSETIVLTNTQGTSESAMTLTSTAGGVDIDAAATKDVNIAGGQVAIVSKENVSSAISLNTNQGTSETIVITNSQGTADASIAITSTAGGVKINTASSKATSINGNLQGASTSTDSNTGAISGFDAALNEVGDASTTAYTMQSSDNGKVLTFSNSNLLTVTIGTGLGNGFNCLIVQKAAGKVKIVHESGTSYIVNRSSEVYTKGQWAVISIINIGSEKYIISGDTGDGT